jgi:hypothetical protein
MALCPTNAAPGPEVSRCRPAIDKHGNQNVTSLFCSSGLSLSSFPATSLPQLGLHRKPGQEQDLAGSQLSCQPSIIP